MTGISCRKRLGGMKGRYVLFLRKRKIVISAFWALKQMHLLLFADRNCFVACIDKHVFTDMYKKQESTTVK